MLRKCGRGPEDTRGYEMTGVKRLGYCVDGVWKDSKTSRYVQITDSSTGEVIAETPMCTTEEVTEAVESAHAAFGPWASKPIAVRTQVPVSYTHLRAHETRHDIVCRLLLE